MIVALGFYFGAMHAMDNVPEKTKTILAEPQKNLLAFINDTERIVNKNASLKKLLPQIDTLYRRYEQFINEKFLGNAGLITLFQNTNKVEYCCLCQNINTIIKNSCFGNFNTIDLFAPSKEYGWLTTLNTQLHSLYVSDINVINQKYSTDENAHTAELLEKKSYVKFMKLQNVIKIKIIRYVFS
jgi:hypothetical protein